MLGNPRLLLILAAATVSWAGPRKPPSCRFATDYSASSILKNPSAFETDLLTWEGMFHQHNVSYNSVNGMTFDGTLLDPITGVHNVNGLHTFSAASKESLHIMILAHVIEGKKGAVQWILAAHGGGSNTERARSIAIDIIERKWTSYSSFNQTYPGFGGFLPWFAHTEFQTLAPTWDWVNRVPALDNGENMWAIYALIEALQSVKGNKYTELASKWQGYLSYLSTTMSKVFYRGNGRICAVTNIKDQSLQVDDPSQSYVCEGVDSSGNPFINDPFEGQQFMWYLYLFGSLNRTEKQALLEFKRPQLVSNDWSRPGYPIVTVQKGFWFSSHENWGLMQMPYTDVPLMQDIYSNMERVRTCDSQSKNLPGMFASINNSTDSNGQIIGYISNAGIPEIANQTIQELDVITPYSTMNMMITNKTIGLVWWHNMAIAKRMQNPYGSSESTRIDGTATSSFVSWDSKVTTVNGLLGGVTSLVRTRMQRDRIYKEFIDVVSQEWSRVFTRPLKGVDMPYCLPVSSVTDTGLNDFSSCSM
ncbi:putative GPI anchored protein [Crassisporium funariophilum]|nr:putative GPI anchored protein [Crassisporium funariophilum]